jgi:hypothetical protein
MGMKKSILKDCVIILAVVALLIPSLPRAEATASNQTFIKDVSLENFDVKLTYPSTLKPGESISILLTATAKNDRRILELTVNIYSYTAGGDLQRIDSFTIIKDKYVTRGDVWRESLTVTVPSDTPRSVLIGAVSEVWEEPVYYWAYWAYWWDDHYPWPVMVYYYYPYYYRLSTQHPTTFLP